MERHKKKIIIIIVKNKAKNMIRIIKLIIKIKIIVLIKRKNQNLLITKVIMKYKTNTQIIIINIPMISRITMRKTSNQTIQRTYMKKSRMNLSTITQEKTELIIMTTI